MSKYILTRGTFQEVSNDELMHWKYIKRKKINGKWRYWYDYKSLKKDVKSALKTVTNKTRNIVSSGKKRVSSYGSKSIGSTIKSTVNKISNDTKKLVSSIKKNVYKYIAKVPTKGDTYRYFYSEKAYQAYLKGKNTADKALSINVTPSDVAKTNASNFVANALSGGFGKAVYNAVAPALAAVQVALTTPKSFDELKKTSSTQSSDEHQKAINPGRDITTYDRTMNCTFCSSAYDLRKRGYDVEANPISMCEAYTIDDVCSWYKNPQRVSKKSIDSYYDSLGISADIPISKQERLSNTLRSNGDGSRGHLILYWLDGSAHDVIWEVENGEAVIRDCQTGEISRTFDMLSYAVDYEYIRTDNLEPTEEILRTVRNRKR